jgi:hypothetical protein
VIVFAMDAMLVTDGAALDVLLDAIRCLRDDAKVCIAMYGQNINVLRLGSGVLSRSSPVASDVFPGCTVQNPYFGHMLTRGMYSAKAQLLKNNLAALRSSIESLVAATGARTGAEEKGRDKYGNTELLRNEAKCSVDALVALAVTLGCGDALALSNALQGTGAWDRSSRSGSGSGSGKGKSLVHQQQHVPGSVGGLPLGFTQPGARLVLLAHRGVVCEAPAPVGSDIDGSSVKGLPVTGMGGSGPNTPLATQTSAVDGEYAKVNNALSAYLTLGTVAFRLNCCIDVFYASMRSGNLDQLDALVSPSGGFVVAGNEYSEAHLSGSMLQLMQRLGQTTDAAAAAGVSSVKIPTIEIRTCGKLAVDRIIGGLVAGNDVPLHNRNGKPSAEKPLKRFWSAGSSTDTSSSGGGFGERNVQLTQEAAALALDTSHLAQSHFYAENQHYKQNQQPETAASASAPSSGFGLGSIFSTSSGNSNSNGSGFSVGGGVVLPLTELQKKIVQRNSQFVVLSGISARPVGTNSDNSCDKESSATISVQFKVTGGDAFSAAAVTSIGKGGILRSAYTQLATAGNKEDEQSQQQRTQGKSCYVQFVVRFYEYSQGIAIKFLYCVLLFFLLFFFLWICVRLCYNTGIVTKSMVNTLFYL